MKLGQQALEALQAEITGKIYPGDDLVVAGETGISGTLELIWPEWISSEHYFQSSFLRSGGGNTEKLYDFRRRCILERSWVFCIVFYRERWNFKWSVENGRSFWSWYGCRSSQNSNPAGDDRSL